MGRGEAERELENFTRPFGMARCFPVFPFSLVELEDEAFFVLEFTCLTALCSLDALSFLDDLSGLSGLPGLSGLSGFPGLLIEGVLGSGDFLLVIEDGFFPSP